MTIELTKGGRYQKTLKERRREQGVCLTCGREKPLNRTKCEICAKRDQKQSKESRLRKEQKIIEGTYEPSPYREGTGRPMKEIFEIGKEYNHLTVLKRIPHKKGYICLVCKCDCGNETTVLWSNLRRGLTTSCGCAMLKKVCLPIRADAAYNAIFRQYMQGAKTRNLPWGITREQFIELTTQNCFYCGSAPFRKIPTNLTARSPKSRQRQRSEWPLVLYNGVDRRRNDLGYFPENCVACCFQCNRSKWVYTEKEFVDWVTRVYFHSAFNDLPDLPERRWVQNEDDEWIEATGEWIDTDTPNYQQSWAGITFNEEMI